MNHLHTGQSLDGIDIVTAQVEQSKAQKWMWLISFTIVVRPFFPTLPITYIVRVPSLPIEWLPLSASSLLVSTAHGLNHIIGFTYFRITSLKKVRLHILYISHHILTYVFYIRLHLIFKAKKSQMGAYFGQYNVGKVRNEIILWIWNNQRGKVLKKNAVLCRWTSKMQVTH